MARLARVRLENGDEIFVIAKQQHGVNFARINIKLVVACYNEPIECLPAKRAIPTFDISDQRNLKLLQLPRSPANLSDSQCRPDYSRYASRASTTYQQRISLSLLSRIFDSTNLKRSWKHFTRNICYAKVVERSWLFLKLNKTALEVAYLEHLLAGPDPSERSLRSGARCNRSSEGDWGRCRFVGSQCWWNVSETDAERNRFVKRFVRSFDSSRALPFRERRSDRFIGFSLYLIHSAWTRVCSQLVNNSNSHPPNLYNCNLNLCKHSFFFFKLTFKTTDTLDIAILEEKDHFARECIHCTRRRHFQHNVHLFRAGVCIFRGASINLSRPDSYQRGQTRGCSRLRPRKSAVAEVWDASPAYGLRAQWDVCWQDSKIAASRRATTHASVDSPISWRRSVAYWRTTFALSPPPARIIEGLSHLRSVRALARR